jgi:uncharacterized RDD family membrane protein YckC
MTTPTQWTPPEVDGPAPGVAFGSPGARLIAYVVDIIIQFGVSTIIFVASVILGAIFLPIGLIAGLAGFLFLLLYFPYYWQKSGQTPGMKMLSIKVVRDRDGGPVSWGQAILRVFGYWISGLVFYLGYIWIFIDKRKRGWHDLIAGTIVIEAEQA